MKRSSRLFAAVIAGACLAAGMARADENACQPDVQKFCSDTQKGGGRMMACLKSHGPELSDPCKTEIRADREKIRAKLKAMNEACGADRQKFCSDVHPGAGRIKECMAQHTSELTDACRAFVEQKPANPS